MVSHRGKSASGITRRSLLRLGAVGVVSSGVLTIAQRPLAAEASSGWKVLARHPQAAKQPTAQGRQIRDLVIFKNRLFAGYGDYNVNTGPIVINGYNLAKDAFDGPAMRAHTHQIGVWRKTSFGLVAPTIDPLMDVPQDPNDPHAGIAWSADGRNWKHTRTGRAFHVFDYADCGSNRFAVGSTRANNNGAPAIWRRRGANAWRLSTVRDDVAGVGNDRYYWIANVDGVPYVQARWPNGYGPMRKLNYGQNTWVAVKGVNEQFHPSPYPAHVEVCQNTIISMTPNRLRMYAPKRGRIWTVNSPDGSKFRDVFVNGTALWVMTARGIFRSFDLGQSFTRMANTPENASCMAARPGTIFVGTTKAWLMAKSF